MRRAVYLGILQKGRLCNRRSYAAEASAKAEGSPAGKPGLSDEEILKKVKLPPKGLLGTAMLLGASSSAIGMGVGASVMGGVVPVAVLFTAAVPLAVSMCFVEPSALVPRVAILSTACLPIGAFSASLLSMASWPPAAAAVLLIGPSLATAYSAFHVAEGENADLDLISLPESPFSRALQRIGLWNRHTPWAHKAFRDVFKLYFYYTALSTLPAFWAMYGWWEVWLGCVWLWEFSFTAGLTSMMVGFFLSNADGALSPGLQARFPRLPMELRSLGSWLIYNHVTTVLWMYAFYALPVMLVFFLVYKWKHGAWATPFDTAAPAGTRRLEALD